MRHALDGAEGRGEHPASRQRDDKGEQQRERERTDQRSPPGLFVRGERHACDNRPQPFALEHGGHCIEPDVRIADVEEATAAPGQGTCRIGNRL